MQDGLFLGSLCLIDDCGLLTLRSQNLCGLLSLGGQDLGALVTLSLHLLLHCRKHRVGRRDVLQFHTVHHHAPLVGGIVEHGGEFFINGIARGKRLVEFQFTNDVTQRGLCQLLYGVGQVVNLVDSLEGIHNLEVEQRIDLRLHIILCNHVLLREVIHLFAKVDSGRVLIPSVVEHHNRLGAVDERNDDVDTRLKRGIVAS